MNKIVIIHEEYVRLKEQQKDALERLSRLICVYDDMLLQQKPHLEALYAESFGALEQACYASYVQEAALRRKIDLVRIYLNRDTEPDFEAVEERLRVEFQKYEEELKRMEAEHQTALLTLSARALSEKDTKRLKQLYRFLAKKLHPDLNSEQTEKVKGLWQRAMDAYRMGDLTKLEILAEIVEVDKIKITEEDKKAEEDALECLQAQLNKTREQINSCLLAIERLEMESPFKFEKLLHDPSAIIERRREIQERKKVYDEKIKAHEEYLALLLCEKPMYVH